jgi:hypothetical protein
VLIAELTGTVGVTRKLGAALFLLRRFVLPVLAHHQQCWGLHAGADAWADVDTALDDFCMALCPESLRAGFANSRLRDELALPPALGGLGIPRAAAEAPYRAAAVWRRDDAEATHASAQAVMDAYRRDDTNRWCAVSLDAAHKAWEKDLAASPTDKAGSRRRELNKMKGAMRSFDAVPWAEELSLDDAEFDVAWRLAFGGVTEDMTNRIDDPADGFAWRGGQMERALATAVDAVFPCPMRVVMQPVPERMPPDHAERLVRQRLPPGADIRADVLIAPATGKRFTFDVRTVNGLCASALKQHSTAAAHVASLERQKYTKYAAYYANFAPFVVTLSGAVSDASHRALNRVATDVAKACEWAMDWEPARWVDNVLHRVAVAMIRTIACVVVRSSRASLSLPCVS